MDIQVEYLDVNDNISNEVHNLTRLAFIKHMGIAGQAFAPRPQNITKILGMFLQYSYYTQRQEFNDSRFSEPPIELSDPTEKGQFSNIAGKAIADFLTKRINESLFTVNYEAAMRILNMPIEGCRPDLLSFTYDSVFAIEAKGYSGGHGRMEEHKLQSMTGGIEVDFTVASVSYNLYSQVKCKYHDPYIDNLPYNNDLLRQLTKNYYSGLLEFLNLKFFDFNEIEIQGEKFYEVSLSNRTINKFLSSNLPFTSICYHKILDYYNPKIILPHAISDYATNGITNKIKPFIYSPNEEGKHHIYIDNDRIGLKIRK